MYSLRSMIRSADKDVGVAVSERTRRFVAPPQKSLRLWPNPQALNLITLLASGRRLAVVDVGAGPVLRSAIGAPHPLLEGAQALTLEYPYLVPALRRAAPTAAVEPLSPDLGRSLNQRSTGTIFHLSTILERVPDPFALLTTIRDLVTPFDGVVVTISAADAARQPLQADTYQRWTSAEFVSFAARAKFRSLLTSVSARSSCFLLARDELALPPWSHLLSLIASAGPTSMSVMERSEPAAAGSAKQHLVLQLGEHRYEIARDGETLSLLSGPAQKLEDDAAVQIGDLDNLEHLEPLRKIAATMYTPNALQEANQHALSLIENSVKKREPLAAVRVSHAEIRAFGYPRYYPPIWLNRSLKVCFGDNIFVEDYADFLTDLDDAIRSSDILGVPKPTSRDLQHATNAIALDTQGIGADKAKFFGDLHFTLLLHGHLDRLIRDSVNVTLITSRDIAPGFRRKFNKPHTRQITIPGEARWMGVGERRHVPDVYNELIQTLEIRERGELFLIGAGLATKKYCQVVRDRGGIALDLGSVFDLWAGAATRTGFEEQMHNYSLVDH